jgi:hypothetical protein
VGEASLNHDQIVALYVIGVLILVFGLGFWRRRQNFFYNLRQMILAAIAGGILYWVFSQVPQLQGAASITAGIVALLLYLKRPSRKRGMRAETKRRVVAKWMASTGQKYNPRTHEIDHIVPFAKGGSDTADNLQVVEKKKNRSKGAKSPWWDMMGR